MDDTSFLEHADKGDILVQVRGSDPNSPDIVIDGVDSNLVHRLAPAIFKRITVTADGLRTLFFKESAAVIVSLFRFLYLDDYLATENLIGSPCSLLLHCQLYKLGLTFDMPKLVALAAANANREVELSCSNPPMVLDLVDAIRFMYLELPDAHALFNTVANYCVGCYIYHGLVESEEFRQTLFGAPEFLKLLLKTSMDRGFDAEGAQDLIQADACEHRLHLSADPDIRAAARFTCHLHNETIMSGYVPPRDIWREPTEYTLVHRPHFPTGMPTSEEIAIQLQDQEYSLAAVERPNVAIQLQDQEYSLAAFEQPNVASHWADAPETVTEPRPSPPDEHSDSSTYPITERPETPLIPKADDADYLWTFEDPVPPELRRLTVTNYSDADMDTLEEVERSTDRERDYQRMADEAYRLRNMRRGFPLFAPGLLVPVAADPPAPAAADSAPDAAPAADPRGKGKARAPDVADDESDADWTLV